MKTLVVFALVSLIFVAAVPLHPTHKGASCRYTSSDAKHYNYDISELKELRYVVNGQEWIISPCFKASTTCDGHNTAVCRKSAGKETAVAIVGTESWADSTLPGANPGSGFEVAYRGDVCEAQPGKFYKTVINYVCDHKSYLLVTKLVTDTDGCMVTITAQSKYACPVDASEEGESLGFAKMTKVLMVSIGGGVLMTILCLAVSIIIIARRRQRRMAYLRLQQQELENFERLREETPVEEEVAPVEEQAVPQQQFVMVSPMPMSGNGQVQFIPMTMPYIQPPQYYIQPQPSE